MLKKAQTEGIITQLVFGIAGLVIGVIIAFVIVSTLTGAGLLTSSRTSDSVSNESDGWVNSTGYQLDGLDTNYVPGTIVISEIRNESNILVAANYTVSSTGTVTNATEIEGFMVASALYNMSYSFSIYSVEELSSDRLDANFTAGVDKVSAKLPTVLLVAAIVLILGILAILIAVWQKMRMSGGGI